MINVTKSYLPDINKYKGYIDQIYESGWLTNNGQLLRTLQKQISEYLGVKNLLLVSNGTLALQLAYKVLGLSGKIITTPFSFVATTSSMVWEGLTPVFADIDPRTFNIDPVEVTKVVSKDCSAIVATHVFGNCCDIERLDFISQTYNLPIIYDAAHAFDVRYKGSSIMNFGDISIMSFHSTKLFHSIEGGALVFKDERLYEKAQKMINFGIVSPLEIAELGINCKMNEFQAAMGLCVLDDINEIRSCREVRYQYYKSKLEPVSDLELQQRSEFGTNNFSHFPVLFPSETILLKAEARLHELGVVPRRYFYPSLNKLPYLDNYQPAPVSESIAERILCLPLFHDIERETQDLIIKTVIDSLL